MYKCTICQKWCILKSPNWIVSYTLQEQIGAFLYTLYDTIGSPLGERLFQQAGFIITSVITQGKVWAYIKQYRDYVNTDIYYELFIE